jgi:hypothetical protein
MAGRSRTEAVSLYAGAFFLFGLAILVITDTIWPGILVLLWLTSIPILLAENGWLGVWIIAQMTLWMIGLPVLFAVDFFWPGILVLAGFSTLLVAVAPPEKMEQLNKRGDEKAKRKLKRDMPLP